MQKITLSLFLLVANFISIAQVNLVPNPSFENIQSCPNAPSQLSLALPWSQAGTGTPDLFATCASVFQVSVAANELGSQYPHSGSNYAGIICLGGGYTEYMEVPLTNSLIAGQKYFLSYYVSLADTVANTSSSIGAYFSTSSLSVGDDTFIPVSPQVGNAINNYFDYTSWKKVAGSFIAIGGESYLTIGNFNSTANTNSLSVNTDTVTYDNGIIYFFIDDICVSTDSLFNENWVGNLEQSINYSALEIYPNPVSSLLTIKSKTIIQKISLVDITGKESNLSVEKNQTSLKINLVGCPSGIYRLKVITNETIYFEKIIINH